MKISTVRSPAATLVAVVVATAGVLGVTDRPTTSATGFSASFLTAFPEYERFRSDDYQRLLAGDGLRSLDPQVLYQLVAEAAKRNEPYKALYLARLFTQLRPEVASGWTNRARLATALGFEGEAAASGSRAIGTETPVPPSALPGALTVRPATLHDWAAALALVSDDVAATQGPNALVAVRDDLSGIQMADDEAVAAGGRGPWATAKPVQVDNVLTNLFVMTHATPMDKKSVRGGMLALGAIALGGSTYATATGVTQAAQAFTQMYGEAMSKAFAVKSELKDGSFRAMTFSHGKGTQVEVKPQTAGKYEAVSTPLPILWASGGSMSPTVRAQWKSGDEKRAQAMKLDARTKKQEWKKHEVPALSYPRVHQLCLNERVCSPKLTLFELLLTTDDLAVAAPALRSSLPDTRRWVSMYASGQALSVVAAGETFAGTDPNGVIYVTRHRPTEWLTPLAADARGRK